MLRIKLRWTTETSAFAVDATMRQFSTVAASMRNRTKPQERKRHGGDKSLTSDGSLYTSMVPLLQKRSKGASHNSENTQGLVGLCKPPYPSYDHVLQVFGMGSYRGRVAPVVDVSTLARFHSITDSKVIIYESGASDRKHRPGSSLYIAIQGSQTFSTCLTTLRS